MELLGIVVSAFLFAAVVPWLHRWLGNKVVVPVAFVPLGITVYAWSLLESVSQQPKSFQLAWLPELGLSLSLYLDGLSLLFVLVIAAVGVLVTLYAGGYLAGHNDLGYFCAVILVFMGSMLGLVLAANLICFYVFWELTTISSFLLIGFDHQREEARSAAIQALLTTAGGGLALLCGLILLSMIGGSSEFTTLAPNADAIREHQLYPLVVGLLLLGAFTKSAQFPFHFWLPNAMEAPTPVSAYLHSATMVKAGVYLLARFTPMLGGTDLWLVTVTAFGAVTMVAGAFLAFFEKDLKGILAYLTINVLGTLVMLLGVGTEAAIKAAMTYLLAHALYKGALFLIAGIVDHEAHSRDVDKLSGLYRRMPVTTVLVVAAVLSMAGVMPLFGFIAKELYLDAVWHASVTPYTLTLLSVFASTFVVAGACIVSVRPFFGPTSPQASQAHEPGLALLLSPLLLAAMGIAVGLFPEKLAGPLLGSAAAATLGSETSLHLALWHGFTPQFALSLIALAGGVGLFVLRERAQRWLAIPCGVAAWGPAAWYDRTIRGLQRFAAWQTDQLQVGYLRVYVTVIVSTMVVVVGLMFARFELPLKPFSELDVRVHEAVTCAVILAAAFVACVSSSRLHTVAALGVVGFNIAWLYNLFGAPDLAMTQIVVEALTVILLVLAFYRLPKYTILSSRVTRIRDASLAIFAGGLVTCLLLIVARYDHDFAVSKYYLEHSVPLAHGRNVVNVILVDFRALDTLGEMTVLGTAAIGVYSLLKLRGRKAQE